MLFHDIFIELAACGPVDAEDIVSVSRTDCQENPDFIRFINRVFSVNIEGAPKTRGNFNLPQNICRQD